MATIETRRQTFDMGRVVSRTFGSIGRNAATFFVLAIVLVGIPIFGLNWLQSQLNPVLNPGASAAGGLAFTTYTIVSPFLRLFLSGLLQAVLVYGVVSDLNGKRASIGESLSTGLRYAVPVAAISFLAGLGAAFGLILLIVPGLMLATAWIVAVPAEVADRAGVFGSFSRSRELTRGSRWAIFGLMAVYLIVAMIIQYTVLGILFGIAGFAPGRLLTNMYSLAHAGHDCRHQRADEHHRRAGTAAIYCELREIKEGVAPSTLASVFDWRLRGRNPTF